MPKTEKTPHPRSRKAEQLVKKSVQKLRRTEHDNAKNQKLSVLQRHCLFYNDYVKQKEEEYKQQHPNLRSAITAKKRFTENEVHEMIEVFLKHRVTKLNEKYSTRRQKLTTKLQMAGFERDEYEKGGGLKAPDLTVKDNYQKFLLWDKEAKTLASIKMKNFNSLNDVSSVWKEVKDTTDSNAMTI
jgi:hypothetical protein